MQRDLAVFSPMWLSAKILQYIDIIKSQYIKLDPLEKNTLVRVEGADTET